MSRAMPGRTCYIVSYDIRDPKRLRETRRMMMGFGDPLHYSVFRCDLPPQGRVELVAAITDVIKHDEDRVMIVDLGPAGSAVEKRIEFLGVRPSETEHNAVIA